MLLRRRISAMEDALNQRRDALQWERDEELASLEKEESSLSDLKVGFWNDLWETV